MKGKADAAPCIERLTSLSYARLWRNKISTLNMENWYLIITSSQTNVCFKSSKPSLKLTAIAPENQWFQVELSHEKNPGWLG